MEWASNTSRGCCWRKSDRAPAASGSYICTLLWSKSTPGCTTIAITRDQAWRRSGASNTWRWISRVCAAAFGVVTCTPPPSELSPPGTGTSVPITYTGIGSPAWRAVASAMRANPAARSATISSGSGLGSSAQDMLQSRWILWKPAAT